MIVPGLVLSVNGSWDHARYVGNTTDVLSIDDRVQSVPDVTASASLAYRRPLTASLALIGRVDTNYVGSRIDATFTGNYLGPYALTNVRAGVEGEHWTAAPVHQ